MKIATIAVWVVFAALSVVATRMAVVFFMHYDDIPAIAGYKDEPFPKPPDIIRPNYVGYQVYSSDAQYVTLSMERDYGHGGYIQNGPSKGQSMTIENNTFLASPSSANLLADTDQ